MKQFWAFGKDGHAFGIAPYDVADVGVGQSARNADAIARAADDI